MSKLAVLGGVSGLQAGGGWDDESMAWGMAGDMTMVDVTRDEKLSPWPRPRAWLPALSSAVGRCKSASAPPPVPRRTRCQDCPTTSERPSDQPGKDPGRLAHAAQGQCDK